MMRLLLALTAGFFVSSQASAQDCSCAATGSPETIQEIRSANGRLLSLRVPAAPVSMRSDLGFVCQEPAGSINLARLWMPEHGHGSGPTRIVPVRSDCTRVERIRFSMPGAWEIQVRFDDGDTGSFTLDVVR